MSIKKHRSALRFILLAIILISNFLAGAQLNQKNWVSAQTGTILPESNDFATAVFRNPWDMSEFDDISQYLNHSGQYIYLDQILVQNGIFSARSTALKDAQFHVLWPGYNTTMLIGDIGNRYPIDADTYHCLHFAMRIESDPPGGGKPIDQFQVFWFEDERLNTGTADWGYSYGFPTYPEAGSGSISHRWMLYSLDLASPSVHWGGDAWTSLDEWQGLRIDPSIQSGIDFEFDWVRLTDCQPVILPISWSGSQDVSIWIESHETGNQIQIADNVSGSSYNLDTQGIAAGTYTYLVKDGSQTIKSDVFEINQAPTGEFARPSFTTGEDYAEQAGNPWDFEDQSDVSNIWDVTYSFHDGVLEFSTQSGWEHDSRIELNFPEEITDSSEYRYLNFRMYTDEPWENIPEGMIIRLFWTVPGGSGRQGYECHMGSQDIPYNTGWQTYSIDLHHPFNGYAEIQAGDCRNISREWVNTSPIIKLRFDPNENIMGHTIHQKLDWIKLTKPDIVVQGTDVPVQFGLNKNPEALSSATFYYTDNLNQPTQHPAESAASNDPLPAQQKQENSIVVSPDFNNFVYIPMFSNYIPTLEFPYLENAINFPWDTSNVQPGEYYMCVGLGDSFNQNIVCSESTIVVSSP
jgi:hypothetical protein